MKRKIIFYFVISFVTIIFTSSIVFAAGSISGKVILQSRTNHQNLITFRLTIPGESQPIKTYEVNTSSDGSYTLTDIPQGTYNLSAKAPTFLSQTQVLIEVLDGQETANVDFSLLGGDANNDNSVAAADMVILRNAWLTNEGQPKYDPRADFNADKSVATADMVILRSNWLKNGTEPQITIISPEENSITSNPTMSVSGSFYSINGSSAVTILVNNTPATITNNTFTADNIRLSEGKNRIYAVATNQYNNKNADLIDITLDVDPPAIDILIPRKDSTTRSNIVYGRISEDKSQVMINDTPADVIPAEAGIQPRFIARPPLTEGKNIITVWAKDIAGNTNITTHSFTYNTTTPKVTITSPQDNSEKNTSPIKVEGTNTDDIDFILVNLQTALIENNTAFIAEDIPLNSPKTIITATGYDQDNNKFLDSILINSPNLSHYELQNISGDVTEDDPNRPQAGSNHTLIVKLEKNNLPAPNEEIQFRITQGQGTLSSPSSFTDINGEATATLTLDTNSEITNQVEAYPTKNPLVKTIFSIDTRPANPSILIKITDDTQTSTPNATIPLIVKLTDQYNNLIPDEQINFQIIQGNGTLSSLTATTSYYGGAKTNLTTSPNPNELMRITASSSTSPLVTTTFNITTSSPSTVTVEELFNRVELNAQKIQDQIVEVTVVSDDPYRPATSQYKVWQKEDLFKAQDMSTGESYLRPLLTPGATHPADTQIISYDSNTNIYVVKTKAADQAEERPYTLTYIDYSKGIITRIDSYYEMSGFATMFVTEMKDFIQLPEANNAWVYNTKVEKMYEGENKLVHSTTVTVTNRQINVGLTDGDFK